MSDMEPPQNGHAFDTHQDEPLNTPGGMEGEQHTDGRMQPQPMDGDGMQDDMGMEDEEEAEEEGESGAM